VCLAALRGRDVPGAELGKCRPGFDHRHSPRIAAALGEVEDCIVQRQGPFGPAREGRSHRLGAQGIGIGFQVIGLGSEGNGALRIGKAA